MELNGEKRPAIYMAGEMAMGISHQIRNPITTVRGFLQLFSSKSELMRYKEYFTLMIDELDKVNSIIKEFLLMAKNKKVDLSMRDLNMIIKDLYPLIKADAMISGKNVDLELGIIPDLFLDEHEIRRLILHLVSNGLEAMVPGGKLTIKTYKEGDGVVLAVQDQGYEIAHDILGKIGTPFFTTKDYGIGLGLAVCNSIADRHNGVIQIETGPAGTTVLVRLMNPP